MKFHYRILATALVVILLGLVSIANVFASGMPNALLIIVFAVASVWSLLLFIAKNNGYVSIPLIIQTVAILFTPFSFTAFMVAVVMWGVNSGWLTGTVIRIDKLNSIRF